MTTPGCDPDPLSMTAREYAEACAGMRGGRFEAMARYRRAFREGDGSAIPGGGPETSAVRRTGSPEGEVVKFLIDVPGNALGVESAATESVVIPMIGKRGVRSDTLCVSSQVGCAMGCEFCETAQMGLVRSLGVREIVQQWWAATHLVAARPKNIVFMGMGEPMDNLDAVIGAIDVLRDDNGAAVPVSSISVSTVGHVEGIRRLGERVRTTGWHRLNLAVSLNAPNDEIRRAIMPIARRWSLDDLRGALLDWPVFGGTKICVEYVLIPGVNDAPEHARQVAAFVQPLLCCVNVIPYNPRRNSPWPAPSEEQVERFMRDLMSFKVFTKRRRTKGRDEMAACGQLGAEHIRARRVVRVGLPNDASTPGR